MTTTLHMIRDDAPTTLYDPDGERCTMLAAHGSHCRVRYCDGKEDQFRIEDMEHPRGKKGLTECVTHVSMREVIKILQDGQSDS